MLKSRRLTETNAPKSRPGVARAGQSVNIGLVGPDEPQALNLVLQGTVLDQRRRLDAAAHRVRREARRRVRSVPVRSHQRRDRRAAVRALCQPQPICPLAYTSDITLSDTTVYDSDVGRWLLDDEVVAQSVLQPRRNRRGGDLRDPIPKAGREPEPAVGPTTGLVTVPAALPHALGWHIAGLPEPASRESQSAVETGGLACKGLR